MKHAQFHIQFNPASDNWPMGSWALYQIDGDAIAKCIGFGPDGREVVRRDPWPGYVGTFGSTEQLNRAMVHLVTESAK